MSQTSHKGVASIAAPLSCKNHCDSRSTRFDSKANKSPRSIRLLKETKSFLSWRNCMRFMSRAMVVVSDLCKNGLNYIYYSIIIQAGPKDLYCFSRLDDVIIDKSISVYFYLSLLEDGLIAALIISSSDCFYS